MFVQEIEESMKTDSSSGGGIKKDGGLVQNILQAVPGLPVCCGCG